jgi:ABC-2 type transport system permease protein
MGNKLKFLIGQSFHKKTGSKQFIIINIIVAILIIGLTNIDSIIKSFGGDFNESQEVYVIDNTNQVYDAFKTSLEKISTSTAQTSTALNYKIEKYDGSIDDAKKYISEHNKVWVVVFDKDDTNYMKATIISESYIDTINYQVLSSVINSIKGNYAISESGIDPNVISSISAPVNIERVLINASKKSTDEYMSTIMSTVFPIVVLPMFMLIILLIQMVGSEINEEKTSRGMEIIIGNVSPRTHFMSKVIASNLFVLLQAVLLVIYGGIGLLIRKATLGSVTQTAGSIDISQIISVLNNATVKSQLIQVLPFTIILMILTFIAYSLVSGILASITTNAEDLQQMQTPMMLILLLGYYLSIMAGMFKGSIAIRIISYLPLVSAILSPSLLMLGDIGVIDIIVSIALLVLFIYIMLTAGMRIYKEGILNYSSKDLWKKFFKSVKSH